MGESIIKKHFTDNKKIPSPNSYFTMGFIDFKLMIIKSKIIEKKIKTFQGIKGRIKSYKKLT